MKNVWMLSLLSLCFAALLFVPSARAEDKDKEEKEEAIALDKVPEAVLKAAKEAVKDVVLTKAELVTKGGKTVYEFDGKAGDKFYEIKVSAEGKVLKVKEEKKEGQEDDNKK